jgi:hypothetical protein
MIENVRVSGFTEKNKQGNVRNSTLIQKACSKPGTAEVVPVEYHIETYNARPPALAIAAARRV